MARAGLTAKRPRYYKVSIDFLVQLEDPETQDARDATAFVFDALKDAAVARGKGDIVTSGWRTTAIDRRMKVDSAAFPVAKKDGAH